MTCESFQTLWPRIAVSCIFIDTLIGNFYDYQQLII